MASQQFVIFNVNEENFAVEITHVKEIIKPMEIFKIPNTPDFIEGLINLRGKVHTVFNLRKKFHLPSKEFDDNTKIIIVGVNDALVGFIVDAVNEIIRVEEENIESDIKALTSLNKRYITGVAKVEEKIILLLDLAKVLSVEEEELVLKMSK